MKNKFRYTYIALFLLVASISSCSYEKLDAWDENRAYIWFTDSVSTASFLLHQDIAYGQEYQFPIPLTMAGAPADHDRIVNISIASPLKDSRTVYTFPQQFRFRAGLLTDTLYLTLQNAEHLSQVRDTLGLRIEPSDDFMIGLKSNITHKVAIFNGYNQPSWWNNRCRSWFGYFTELKMKIYVDFTGGDEDPTKGTDHWDTIEMKYLVRRLNDYIAAQGIVYPEGTGNDLDGKTPEFGTYKY